MIKVKNVLNKFLIFWIDSAALRTEFSNLLHQSKIDYEYFPYDRSIAVFDVQAHIPLINLCTLNLSFELSNKNYYIQDKQDLRSY